MISLKQSFTMKNRSFAAIALGAALGAALMVWGCQDAASPDMTQGELTPVMSMSGGSMGGPVVLMGIDAEDGNGAIGSAHGGKAPYISVVTDMLTNVSNGGSGILVIGGGKSPTDNVTEFWNAIGTGVSQTVTQVNGATAITAQSFAGFAIIAVASSQNQTFSGGLTNTENSALAGQAGAIATFVNGGGGLIGLSQQGLTSAYPYIGTVGSFTFNFPSQYSQVTPTAAGLLVGIDATNLDVCCWHDEYITFPSFLTILATNDGTTNPAAIGGAQVIIMGAISLSPATSTNLTGTDHTVTAFAQDDSPPAPAVGVTVSFEVTSGPNAGTTGTGITDGSGNTSFTYTGSGGVGTDEIEATFVDLASNLQTSNTVQKTWENNPPIFVAPTPADGTPFNVLANHEIKIDVKAEDPDGQTVTLTAALSPGSGETFTTTPGNPATGTFSWTPVAGDVGSHTVVFTATDLLGASAPDVSLPIEVHPDPCEGNPDCNAEFIPKEGGTATIEEDEKPVGGIDVPTPGEDVIVKVEFPDDCHKFLIAPLGRCVEITGTSVTTGLPVPLVGTVGLCFDESEFIGDPTFSIFGFPRNGPSFPNELPSEQNVDIDEEAEVAFLLDCSLIDFFLASANSNPVVRFASGALHRVKQWLAPPPLMATVTLRHTSIFRGTSGPLFQWAKRAMINPDPIVCNNLNGVIPVALLSVDLNEDGDLLDEGDFDATQVDVRSVRYGLTGSEAAAFDVDQEFVDADLLPDLVFRFLFRDTGLNCTHTFAKLIGNLTNGDTFETADFTNMESGGPDFESSKFLLIDEESIDNGNPPNFFSDVNVNDQIADIGLRAQLPAFAGANVGNTSTLHTGEVGDEGWFALKTIPASWDAAGPTSDGLYNYVGNLVGPGLGFGGDPEALLDKIPDVTPLRATGLTGLLEEEVCAVVYDSDVSINYGPLNGSLKGANLGTVAFKVLSVTQLTGFSSSSLPEVQIEILDANDVCGGPLEPFNQAPEPISSSEPFDVVP